MTHRSVFTDDTGNNTCWKAAGMTPSEFKNQKKQLLHGADLSRKGSIDALIKHIVDFINNLDEFVTTSSCSGRVVLFCESNSGGHKKGCQWLYTSHGQVNEDDFLHAVDPEKGNLVLKFEPMILHVQCFSLEGAKKLHTCAMESGFRNSGISIGKHAKIILAVRSCLVLEVPLSEAGNLLVSDVYLKFLIKIVNEKMDENGKRIERFFNSIKITLNQRTEI